VSTKVIHAIYFLVLVLTGRALTSCLPQTIPASPTPRSYAGDPEAGLLLFNDNCLECHSATLPEVFVGPSLLDAEGRLSVDYIQASVRDPHSVVDPDFAGATPMPADLMERLTDQQLADIIAYLMAGEP
jgi:mono/diheme cytochrome c family protein